MNRLTKRHGKHAVQIGGETRRHDVGWLRLAELEDMIERGILKILPCAEGDTVYWISEPDACLFCNSPCYERCEEGALKIKEIPFKLHMLDEIGEIIFITEEEAEVKLKELQGQ